MISNYLQDQGFEDDTELLRLVASVPFDTTEEQAKYWAWHNSDGTRAGLLKLLRESKATK